MAAQGPQALAGPRSGQRPRDSCAKGRAGLKALSRALLIGPGFVY
jgi:hypothetical protein